MKVVGVFERNWSQDRGQRHRAFALCHFATCSFAPASIHLLRLLWHHQCHVHERMCSGPQCGDVSIETSLYAHRWKGSLLKDRCSASNFFSLIIAFIDDDRCLHTGRRRDDPENAMPVGHEDRYNRRSASSRRATVQDCTELGRSCRAGRRIGIGARPVPSSRTRPTSRLPAASIQRTWSIEARWRFCFCYTTVRRTCKAAGIANGLRQSVRPPPPFAVIEVRWLTQHRGLGPHRPRSCWLQLRDFATFAFRFLSMAGGKTFRVTFFSTGIVFFPSPVLRDHQAACNDDRLRDVTASMLH